MYVLFKTMIICTFRMYFQFFVMLEIQVLPDHLRKTKEKRVKLYNVAAKRLNVIPVRGSYPTGTTARR